jgi:hypothetical protein
VNDEGAVTHYNVPNSNDDTWIESRPKTYTNTIEAKATECGTNFRRIIKMMKHWNRIHSDYLQSYHIEVLALSVFSGNLDTTTWHVHKFFEDARALLRTSLWYDRGYVDSYLTSSDREEVIKRFDTAVSKSQEAWYMTYGSNDDHRGAIELWRQIFGSEFPSYG